MDKYQNRGQGTLNSILMTVFLFLAVDIVLALLLIFNVKLPAFNSNSTDNNPLTNLFTDNIITTDNAQ